VLQGEEKKKRARTSWNAGEKSQLKAMRWLRKGGGDFSHPLKGDAVIHQREGEWLCCSGEQHIRSWGAEAPTGEEALGKK